MGDVISIILKAVFSFLNLYRYEQQQQFIKQTPTPIPTNKQPAKKQLQCQEKNNNKVYSQPIIETILINDQATKQKDNFIINTKQFEFKQKNKSFVLQKSVIEQQNFNQQQSSQLIPPLNLNISSSSEPLDVKNTVNKQQNLFSFLKFDKNKNNIEKNQSISSKIDTDRDISNVAQFVMIAQDNRNILYHNFLQSQSSTKKLMKFQPSQSQNIQNKLPRNIKQKVSDWKRQVSSGLSHYILKLDQSIKKDVLQRRPLIWLKLGIYDWKDKYFTRFKQIFRFIEINTLEQVEKYVEQTQWFNHFPTRIICHHSLFKQIHRIFENNAKVRSISIFTSSFFGNPTEENEQKNEKQFQLSAKQLITYKKFGCAQNKIIQLRQCLIESMIRQELQGSSRFIEFKCFNNEYINKKYISIKSCLIMQKIQSQDGILICKEEAIFQQKMKAKKDLIQLLQFILNSQFYLQYIATLINQQPNIIQNQKKQKSQNVRSKIQHFLKDLQHYPIYLLYENQLTKNKKRLLQLDQLQHLQSFPVTDENIFWDCIDRFLFTNNNLILKLLENFLTQNSLPHQLSYIRLYISDLHISIRELYKLHDDMNRFSGQCYYSTIFPEEQLQILINSSHKIIELDSFLICSFNKEKQMLKPGNIILSIKIKEEERIYENNFGFVIMDNKPKQSDLNMTNKKQTQKNPNDFQKIVFNLLNTFFVQSIRYDPNSQKYIINLLYGYIPEILNRYSKDRLMMTNEEKIKIQYHFNNFNLYDSNIKSQGDTLLMCKFSDPAVKFYQQFLIKAKRQSQINLLKISYIYLGIFRAYVQKKIYNKSLEFLNQSTTTIQKIYGEKSKQIWINIEKQGQIYIQQQFYDRAIQKYTSLNNLIQRELQSLIKKGLMNTQLSIQCKNHQAKSQMKLAECYQATNKQQAAENCYKKAIKCAMDYIGQFNPLMTEIYTKISQFYIHYQVKEKAIFYAKKALAINLNLYGQYNIETGKAYNHVGKAYELNEQFELAYTNYKHSLNIFSKFYDITHEEIISGYKNIGNALKKKNSFDDALQNYFICVKIIEKKNKNQNLAINQIYSSIGQCYKRKGDYTSAVQYYEKNKKISLTVLNQNHEQTNKSYKQIAEVYEKQGKYYQAIEYYEKPLLSIIKNKGKNHPSLVEYYQRLGHLYILQSQQLKQQNSISSKQYEQKAFQYFKKILQVRYSYGRNSFQTAFSMDQIGKAYLIKNDFNNALHHFEQSLTIKKGLNDQKKEKTVSKDSVLATSYYLIGSAYIQKKQNQKAIQYLKDALKIKLLQLGQNNIQVAQIYKKMGRAYLNLQNYLKSQQYYKKLLAIYLTIYGNYNIETTSIYYDLSCLYFISGEFSKSLQLLVKSIEILKNGEPKEQSKVYKPFKLKILQIINEILSKHSELNSLKMVYYHVNKVCQAFNNETWLQQYNSQIPAHQQFAKSIMSMLRTLSNTPQPIEADGSNNQELKLNKQVKKPKWLDMLKKTISNLQQPLNKLK